MNRQLRLVVLFLLSAFASIAQNDTTISVNKAGSGNRTTIYTTDGVKVVISRYLKDTSKLLPFHLHPDHFEGTGTFTDRIRIKGFLDSSAIMAVTNAKAPLTNPSFTGTALILSPGGILDTLATRRYAKSLQGTGGGGGGGGSVNEEAVINIFNQQLSLKPIRFSSVHFRKDADSIIHVTGFADSTLVANYITETETDLLGKQNTLFSGTNIKTVNNTSLLGPGNIAIPTADGSETKFTNGVNTTYSGTGTAANPIAINVTIPTPDGSETKITNGTGSIVTGIGTPASPYQINVVPVIDRTVKAMQEMGSPIKAQTLGLDLVTSTNTQTAGSPQTSFQAVRLPSASLISGVYYLLSTQGVYNANGNYSGIVLYRWDGLGTTTATKVAETLSDTAIWKEPTAFKDKPFTSSFIADAGIYYVGFTFNAASTTTAPGFRGITLGGSVPNSLAQPTGLPFYFKTTTAVGTMPTSISITTISNNTTPIWVGLY